MTTPFLLSLVEFSIPHNADSVQPKSRHYLTQSSMEKTKVVSVRLPERLITKLEESQHRHKWWKKNAIIVQVLSAFLDTADYSTQLEILRYWHCSEKKMVLKFEERPAE